MKKQKPIVTLAEIDEQQWSKQNQIVTLAEQERRGMRRPPAPANYVPPTRNSAPVQVLPPASLSDVRHTLDVGNVSTMHTELRTSAVDRAKGFLLASVPLFATVALLAVLVAWIAFDTPLLSVATLLVFWITFAATWAGTWIYTLKYSSEGIAYFEAQSRWDVIRREQSNRWRYYEKLSGQSRDGDK